MTHFTVSRYVITDKRFEGRFHAPDTKTTSPNLEFLTIEANKGGHYVATFSKGQNWIKLDAVLFKCGTNLFVDISRIAGNGLGDEPAVGPSPLEVLHMATMYKTHSVMRIRFSQRGFEVGWSYGNPVYLALKKYPHLKFRVGTESEPLDPQQQILTNTTGELYTFLQTVETNSMIFGALTNRFIRGT